MAINSLSTGFRPGVCTSSTRPTAPYEGQMIFETDTDRMYIWNGSAWVIPNQTTQNPTGLEIITPTSVTNGTAVNNTVTFSNQSSVTINGIFSSTYTNYRLVYRIAGAASQTCYARMQLTASGTPVTSNYLSKTLWTDTNLANTTIGDQDTPKDSFSLGPCGTPTDGPLSGAADVHAPFVSTISTQVVNSGSGLYSGAAFYTTWGGGFQRNANAYDGIKFYANTGNISGVMSIYGYRNS